jgi:CDP-2,3-bis-(O-geranylgeranyl)-sn-glycerol synthase
MFTVVFSAIYFFLPGYIANTFPVFGTAWKLPLGNPISQKIFGKNKTWRGVYMAYIGALLTLWLQRYFQLSGELEYLRIIDYTSINLWLFAALFGLGVMVGDVTKSFFKRKYGIKSGERWFPFDQIDILLALVIIYPFYSLDSARILLLIVVTPLMHSLTCMTGYWLGIKEKWY